jgi:hypothetical protein
LAYFDFDFDFFLNDRIYFYTKKKKNQKKKRMDGIMGDSSPNLNTQTDWIPHVAMEFNIIEDAWKHWGNYGKQMGFGVMKCFFK